MNFGDHSMVAASDVWRNYSFRVQEIIKQKRDAHKAWHYERRRDFCGRMLLVHGASI